MYSLDTLNTARDLEAAGFAPKQAEALVTAISRADEQLATKNDIAQLATKTEVQELKSNVATVEVMVKAIEGKIGSLRAEFRLLFGFQSAIILAIFAHLLEII